MSGSVPDDLTSAVNSAPPFATALDFFGFFLAFLSYTGVSNWPGECPNLLYPFDASVEHRVHQYALPLASPTQV